MFQHLSEVTCCQVPLITKIRVKSIVWGISRYLKISEDTILPNVLFSPMFLLLLPCYSQFPQASTRAPFIMCLKRRPESLRYGVSLMLVPHVSSLIELFLGWGRCRNGLLFVPVLFLFPDLFGCREFQIHSHLLHDHFPYPYIEYESQHVPEQNHQVLEGYM